MNEFYKDSDNSSNNKDTHKELGLNFFFYYNNKIKTRGGLGMNAFRRTKIIRIKGNEVF